MKTDPNYEGVKNRKSQPEEEDFYTKETWEEARDRYNAAIRNLLAATRGARLFLYPDDFTGTPPYKENKLAGLVDGLSEPVILRVMGSVETETGIFYRCIIMTGKGDLLHQDEIAVRDWHIVHYLLRSHKIEIGGEA